MRRRFAFVSFRLFAVKDGSIFLLDYTRHGRQRVNAKKSFRDTFATDLDIDTCDKTTS